MTAEPQRTLSGRIIPTERTGLVWIGVDQHGDRVWERPDGRWTWGDTRAEATARERSFTPTRYEDKYEVIRAVDQMSPQERAFWTPRGEE